MLLLFEISFKKVVKVCISFIFIFCIICYNIYHYDKFTFNKLCFSNIGFK